MKRILVPLFLAFVAFGSAVQVQAQTRALPNTFTTMVACTAALESGNLRYYEPKYFGLKTRNPTNGETLIVVALESDTCLEMLVVGGRKFVAQHEGTKFRARKRADGSLSLYARDDCGNPVYGVVVPLPVPPATIVLVPEVVPEVVLSPAPPQRVATPVAVFEEAGTQWGLTASAMLGSFKSIPIGSVIEGIAGRSVCVQGRTLDIGFARGGPASSFWRFTFAGKFFDEGSFTQYTCTDCNRDVKTVAASGVRVLGAQVERVVRIEANDRWPIQPMISVYVGGGRISGRATQYTGPVGGSATSAQGVGARELFGSSWFPTAGAGVGVIGDLGHHFTYAITVAGIEYPGVYYGRVSLTYWPK